MLFKRILGHPPWRSTRSAGVKMVGWEFRFARACACARANSRDTNCVRSREVKFSSLETNNHDTTTFCARANAHDLNCVMWSRELESSSLEADYRYTKTFCAHARLFARY